MAYTAYLQDMARKPNGDIASAVFVVTGDVKRLRNGGINKKSRNALINAAMAAQPMEAPKSQADLEGWEVVYEIGTNMDNETMNKVELRY